MYFYSCLLIRLLWQADIPVCRTNKGILILILILIQIQSNSWELHKEVSDVIFWSVINKKMFLISYHVMFVVELLKKENNSGKNGTGGGHFYNTDCRTPAPYPVVTLLHRFDVRHRRWNATKKKETLVMTKKKTTTTTPENAILLLNRTSGEGSRSNTKRYLYILFGDIWYRYIIYINLILIRMERMSLLVSLQWHFPLSCGSLKPDTWDSWLAVSLAVLL